MNSPSAAPDLHVDPEGDGTGAVTNARSPSVAVRSRVEQSIAELDLMRRSMLFAEVSMVAYLPHHDAEPVFRQMGFAEATYVERDGAQAYVLVTEHDRVVACRGTEPTDWNDLRADANALTDLAETIGRVHRGFKREVDDVWPHVRASLVDDGRDVFFTGHSLGAAMATIMAGRCKLEDIPVEPLEVFTFGSPRVGTKRYVQNAGLTHHRWVNNNDVVTRVPPVLFGYQHTGTIMYLDADGRHRRMTPAARAKDRTKGFRAGLKSRRLDHFSDHAIAGYVEYLQANVVAGVSAASPRPAMSRR